MNEFDFEENKENVNPENSNAGISDATESIDVTVTESQADTPTDTSYSIKGSALGDNAVDTFSNPTTRGANQHDAYNYSSGDNAATNSYQSRAYSNEAYMNGVNSAKNRTYGSSFPYNEHIKKKKFKIPCSKRYIAAMLAAAVLNLAILGGAFALGHSFGSKNNTETNKSSLSQSLKSENDSPSSSSATGATNTSATNGDKSTTEIAKEVGPAVVGIKSRIQGQMSLFGGYSESESQGSGIILSGDGYIVTNNHVVSDASSVTVLLNTGSEYPAQVIGTDTETDLAVIKIEPSEELTVASLGDSSKVEVGETAIAIGNPMGVEFFGSVTQGIVSAVNRSVEIDRRTMNLIQTDAAINSGNSGGALINSKGEVIGINTVKVSTTGVEGMGFAIPISEAKPIISDLLEYGYVKGRPIIGISTRDVSSYMAQQYGWPQGAQVISITTENAKNAGLQQGDIITSVDNNKVESGTDLTEYKDTKSPGDTIELEVYKYATGKTEKISVVLSEQIPD